MELTDEKDYIMRMIKQIARMLLALLGKDYSSVTIPLEEEYLISGKNADEYYAMIDHGKVNEAENIMLDGIDYTNNHDIVMAIMFYQYVSDKGNDFLLKSNYSEEEALDGLKQLVGKSGYGSILEVMEQQ